MKTMKIFSIIFTALGMLALIGAISGATHQYVLAGICALLALMMYPDNKDLKELKKR